MNDRGIGSWPARRARGLADQVALVEPSGGGEREVTYRELDALAVRAAHGLRRRGVVRGDRVAFLGLNCVDLVVTMFATAKLGAVFVPLNTRLAAAEYAYIVGDARPRLLVHKDDFSAVVRAAEPDVEAVELAAGDGIATLLADGPPLDEQVGLDDLFMIQYTSGTSGRPKGVRLRHGNIVWNVYNLLADVDVGTDEVALVTAPLFHTAALNQVLLPTVFKGGTALIEPRFDPDRALHLIEQRGVTMLFGVTSMYLAIAAAPGFAEADLSTLRSTLTGGAPVPEPVLRLWAKRGAPLYQGYGMTESSPGATMLRGRDTLRKLGSAGPPVFFSDVRVVDADEEPVPPGVPGEVQIAGPNVSDGYWDDDRATRDAFAEGGWLRSGDMAVVDEDGFLRIVDRVKDMIISGGENVSPAEVEDALHTHPAVAACAVIGVPDERWGEVGRAIVVLREGGGVGPEDLLEHLDGRLARYKIPKSVVLVGELPHNASGKVLKSQLRKEYG